MNQTRTHLLLAAVVLAAIAGCASGSRQDAANAGESKVDAPRAPPRYQVEIDAPREIREMLRAGLRLVRWQSDPEMTIALLERLLDEAADETREAVAARGWFSAKVSTDVDRAREPWTVTLRVDPGPRTRIASVDLRFTGPATDDPQARQMLREVRERWSLTQGEPFEQRRWDEAKDDAVRQLSSWRYAAARIADSRAEIDPKAQTAALTVTLDSGPPFRFGGIRVGGTQRYAEDTVRNLSPIEPGSVFERDKLILYQRQLLEAGYFISARAEVEPNRDAHGQPLPVQVDVIEGPSQNLEAGLHFETDTGVRAEVRYRDVDLRNRGWRLDTELDVGAKEQRTDVSLNLPPRADGRWWSAFSRLERSDVQNVESSEWAVGGALNHGRFGAPSGPVISAHVERQRIAGLTADYRRAVYLAYRWSFRETDDLVLPRAGYFGQASIGFAPSALSTRRFGRGNLRLAYLRPIGDAGSLLLRGELGAVVADSRDGIPSTFLFRTGGDQSVRGYAFESLGVRQGAAIVGGRYLAVASGEYTHWIGDNWGLAAFVDAGDAWDEQEALDAAIGYGVGGRFRTPIGPIRADIAYGERTGEFRLHFSIGYQF